MRRSTSAADTCRSSCSGSALSRPSRRCRRDLTIETIPTSVIAMGRRFPSPALVAMSLHHPRLHRSMLVPMSPAIARSVCLIFWDQLRSDGVCLGPSDMAAHLTSLSGKGVVSMEDRIGDRHVCRFHPQLDLGTRPIMSRCMRTALAPLDVGFDRDPAYGEGHNPDKDQPRSCHSGTFVVRANACNSP
jgi:hypothetical protein